MPATRLVGAGLGSLLGVSLLAACTLLPGAVTDLKVGDCFDQPTTEGDISEVQHQPCDQPHDAEAFLTLQHPGDANTAYPVVSGFADYIEENCVPAFAAYTGRDFATDTEYDIGYFHPTLTGWQGGDRGFTCYINRVDDAKMSAPVSQSPAAPGAS